MTQYHEEKFTVNWGDDGGVDDDGVDQSADAYINMRLSESRNNGKTTFCPSDTAYLEVEASGEYTVQASIGTVKKNALGVPIPQSETANLDNESAFSLRREPESDPSIVWNPPIDAAITRNGRDITLSKPVLSIAAIAYNSLADVWALSGITEATEVRVIASAGGNNSALTVSFQCDADDPEEGEVKEVGLKFEQCRTGVPVSGVRVTVEGVSQGSTNSGGIVSIGERTIGDSVSGSWVYGSRSGTFTVTV